MSPTPWLSRLVLSVLSISVLLILLNKMKNEEERKANAFLRERFLYLISSVCGNRKLCKISMYENTEVTGIIKAVDIHFANMIVENLKTPLPEPVKMASLRTRDILTFSFKQ